MRYPKLIIRLAHIVGETDREVEVSCLVVGFLKRRGCLLYGF